MYFSNLIDSSLENYINVKHDRLRVRLLFASGKRHYCEIFRQKEKMDCRGSGLSIEEM